MKVNKSLQIQSKYQHKLIALIATLEYINKNKKKYNQSDILYCFNSNLKRNGQKEASIKTLQNYFYKLKSLILLLTIIDIWVLIWALKSTIHLNALKKTATIY